MGHPSLLRGHAAGQSAPQVAACRRWRTALLSACKLLFKLSKSAQHDAHFRQHGALLALVQLLGRAVEVEHAASSSAIEDDRQCVPNPAWGLLCLPLDVLTYAAGAVKNVSASEPNQEALLAQGAAPALVRVVRAAVWDAEEALAGGRRDGAEEALTGADASAAGASEPWGRKRGKQCVHVLVQATATLRNLATHRRHMRQLAATGAAAALIACTASFPSHVELCCNALRALRCALHARGRHQQRSPSLRVNGVQQADAARGRPCCTESRPRRCTGIGTAAVCARGRCGTCAAAATAAAVA